MSRVWSGWTFHNASAIKISEIAPFLWSNKSKPTGLFIITSWNSLDWQLHSQCPMESISMRATWTPSCYSDWIEKLLLLLWICSWLCDIYGKWTFTISKSEIVFVWFWCESPLKIFLKSSVNRLAVWVRGRGGGDMGRFLSVINAWPSINLLINSEVVFQWFGLKSEFSIAHWLGDHFIDE